MSGQDPMAGDAPLAELRIPTDAEGPVFSAPWEAQVFALTVNLHRRGCFSWPEWTECLGQELAEATAEGENRYSYK